MKQPLGIQDGMMGQRCQITVNGNTFAAAHGDLLLDAALASGVDLPHDCRSGHCGSCRVRLLAGDVAGGRGSEPGVVHACQSRIAGDAVLETATRTRTRTVEGTLSVLRPATSEVFEIGIRTDRPLPHLPGQYAQIRFSGYPSRPYSITHPVFSDPRDASLWLHVRRMANGRVTTALGDRIVPGHRVSLTGPHGAAYFRTGGTCRILLVATSTGFAPIWSIAAAALRENQERAIMVIAGGRTLQSLYMAPALERLAAFPKVRVLPVCSAPQSAFPSVYSGRPTDHLPQLHAMDEVYACGAPGLVEAVKAIAAASGAVCYADPFLPATDSTAERRTGSRLSDRLAAFDGDRLRASGLSEPA